jgi:low affinity Fe/Cu permease
MGKINHFLYNLAHNYLLVAVAAILFFLAKALIGYLTYRHYYRKLKDIEKKLDKLIRK